MGGKSLQMIAQNKKGTRDVTTAEVGRYLSKTTVSFIGIDSCSHLKSQNKSYQCD